MVAVEILDVTQIAPKLKHPTIFRHFDALAGGESFVIDNDHDPKPLYYQLLGERGNIFTWEYLMQGPARWQVKIARLADTPPEETIGAIAAKDMRKAAVFKAKGIDYSCGGNKTLSQATAEAGISEEELKRALTNAEKLPQTASQDFTKWSPQFLADYITNTHHRYIRENIEVICGLTEKVANRHGSQHPELYRLLQSVPHFLQNLLTHISKEENTFFPVIRQIAERKTSVSLPEIYEPGLVKQSAFLLQKEHTIIAEDLAYFRRLTDGFSLPEDACNSYTYLYQKLSELTDDLEQYIHLENNILFPKAIALEHEATT
ncbi:MAG: DUF542 domain-containing protein [Chitinophagaceae bacterium]|nr:DUF542 domain-containing protein [Chitinophagaceae bacterium]